MDLENLRKSADVAAHEVPLTAKADHAAAMLNKSDAEVSQYVTGTVEMPKGHKVLGVNLLPYGHPRVQACMLGFILFMTVGMYTVIIVLGGAGQQTAYLSDVSNIALYTVFAVFCLIAPACLNYFGLRPTLFFGGIGYAAYAASLWCYNYTGNVPFVIFGGCWCGLSAAFLWTAEGVGITSFASEDKKGLYVSITWSIYQFGVVIGAAIPVGQNWHSSASGRVNSGTYIGLMILMLCGAALGLVMYPWNKIVREDGTRVRIERQKTFMEEVRSSGQVLRRNWWIIFFAPMCWAVNFFGVYQNNDFNGVVFTVRARALNALCSGVVQIFSPWILHFFTDRLPMKRRKRAFWALVYVFIFINAIWIGGCFAMARTRTDLPAADRLDVYDPGYGQLCFLFAMYGFTDATYNCYAYWFIGALSNDPTELSVYAAMYRLLNSICLIVGYALDLRGYSKEFMFGCSWAFLVFGCLSVLPILKFWMKDTNMIVITEGMSMEADTPVAMYNETKGYKTA